MQITDGYMPYLNHQTYYRIAGNPDSPKTPLLLMHGGPGSTHNYFELLDRLSESGRMIISYDQIGCGKSYIDGCPELWTPETWINELIALRQYLHLDHVHLLGQSWGGMLEILYMNHCHPEGVSSVILSSTLSSSALWAREQHRMILDLPETEQQAIARAEETGDYQNPDYVKANAHYMKLHCADEPTENDPECLRRAKRSGSESYLYAWGPNEYTPTGTLKHYDETEGLKQWTVPALIISGSEDLCTPLVAKTMAEAIPHAEWKLIEHARHMCFADQNEQYCSILNTWLEQND